MMQLAFVEKNFGRDIVSTVQGSKKKNVPTIQFWKTSFFRDIEEKKLVYTKRPIKAKEDDVNELNTEEKDEIEKSFEVFEYLIFYFLCTCI